MSGLRRASGSEAKARLPQPMMRLAALLAVLGVTGVNAQPASGRRVNTPSGPLIGSVANADVQEFLGVPFAEPPIGANRWRAPQPKAPWTELRDATRFAPDCANEYYAPNDTSIPNVAHDCDGLQSYDEPTLNRDEDCLYLNVWTPTTSLDAPTPALLPVMVFIYGGSWNHGATSVNLLNGKAQVQQSIHAGHPVISVTLNYRIGAFGFMAHEDLRDASDGNSVGNYGLRDQTQALAWLQENVASFGGDPDRVMIYGQSAGGASVGVQLVSPLSAGLFSRAVIQSGAYVFGMDPPDDMSVSPNAWSAPYGAKLETLATALGCTASPVDVDCLRAKDWRTVATQFHGGGWSPVVDGVYLTESPKAAMEGGRLHPVPIIVGATRDESSYFGLWNTAAAHDPATWGGDENTTASPALCPGASWLTAPHGPLIRPTAENHGRDRMGGAQMTVAEASGALLAGGYRGYGNVTGAELIRRYGLVEGGDENAFLTYSDISTEGNLCALRTFAQATRTSPVYQYLFARAPVYGLGAFHCVEIPYEFFQQELQYNMSCTEGGAVCYQYSCCDTDPDTQLSMEVLRYLANFAATGDPNTGDQPQSSSSASAGRIVWPQYTPRARGYISLGDSVTREATICARERLREAQCDWWPDKGATNSDEWPVDSGCSTPGAPRPAPGVAPTDAAPADEGSGMAGKVVLCLVALVIVGALASRAKLMERASAGGGDSIYGKGGEAGEDKSSETL